MRRYWPFLAYGGVALVHLVVLGLGQPGMISKSVLMPALLAAVLATVLVTARVDMSLEGVVAPMLLLELAILASWFADIFFLSPPAMLGIAASGVAHVLLAVLFVWPLRSRWRSWWGIPYAIAFAVSIAVLWPALGPLAPLIVGYALALYAMAFLGMRVSPLIGVGGILFAASAVLKGLGLFVPAAVEALPPSLFDLIVMACYCTGIGLIALGSAHRILHLEASKEPARRKTARRWAPPSERREAVPPMR